MKGGMEKEMKDFTFNTIEEAIAAIKAGKMVLVTDDEDRENEGDLIMAAQFCTGESINFMAKEARGLICMPADAEIMDKLQFGAMVSHNTDNHETAFSVSIDHVDTTTGISAYERAYTMKKVTEPGAQAMDFRRPGHVFPLRSRKGGVLVRTGHTETTTDLCRLAGLTPVGICCEIMDEDGHMMRTPQLIEFAKKHNLVFVTVASLVAYRKQHEKMVHRVAEAKLPSKFGTFKIIAYENDLDDLCHIALVKGEVAGKKDVMVRVHSECLTGDAFGSLRCDCGDQLASALRMIEKEGCGVVVYWIPWKPMCGWDLPRTCGTTAWAPRFYRTWVSPVCGLLPTIRQNGPVYPVTASRSPDVYPLKLHPISTMSFTWKRKKIKWGMNCRTCIWGAAAGKENRHLNDNRERHQVTLQ